MKDNPIDTLAELQLTGKLMNILGFTHAEHLTPENNAKLDSIKELFSQREAEIRNARIEGWLAGKGIHASELTLHDVEEAELIDEITANTYPHYKPFIEKLKLESGTADTTGLAY